MEPSGLIERGGPLVWILLGLAFVGTVCVIERLFYFHRARINVGDLLVGLAHHIRRRAFAEALHEAARAPGPVARVTSPKGRYSLCAEGLPSAPLARAE